MESLSCQALFTRICTWPFSIFDVAAAEGKEDPDS